MLDTGKCSLLIIHSASNKRCWFSSFTFEHLLYHLPALRHALLTPSHYPVRLNQYACKCYMRNERITVPRTRLRFKTWCFAIVYLDDTWTFTEDSDQGHVDAVNWSELKSVELIIHQLDCRTAYLQVGIIREFSMTGGPATEVNGRIKVGVGSSGEVGVVKKSTG